MSAQADSSEDDIATGLAGPGSNILYEFNNPCSLLPPPWYEDGGTSVRSMSFGSQTPTVPLCVVSEAKRLWWTTRSSPGSAAAAEGAGSVDACVQLDGVVMLGCLLPYLSPRVRWSQRRDAFITIPMVDVGTTDFTQLCNNQQLVTRLGITVQWDAPPGCRPGRQQLIPSLHKWWWMDDLKCPRHTVDVKSDDKSDVGPAPDGRPSWLDLDTFMKTFWRDNVDFFATTIKTLKRTSLCTTQRRGCHGPLW